MRRRCAAALTAIALLPLAASSVSVAKDPASPHPIQVQTDVGAVKIEPRP